MSCMCGDICCSSCGPAQGNWKCPICNEWASEGCAHIGEDGNIKAEFIDEAAKIEQAQIEADNLYAKEMEELDKELSKDD